MSKFCGFGKEVKKKLVDIDQTQDWLIEQVRQNTSLYFDSGYLHRILRGDAATPKIVQCICQVLEIENESISEQSNDSTQSVQ